VYLLAEGHAGMKDLLGGKGANLAEMTRIGLPVPPGIIVTTEACQAFLKAGERFPAGLWEEILAGVARLEAASGTRLGSPERPLLVSCRSGARFSMPGMMDTILNLGLNDAIVEALARDGAAWPHDAYRRLLQMFGSVVLGVPGGLFEAALTRRREARAAAADGDLSPEDLRALVTEFKAIIREKAGADFPADPTEQLRHAVAAVFRSWNGKRAVDYRNASGIPHDLGTAVSVVAMVFGNAGAGSGTGVLTTRNVSTGEPEVEGDYLTSAQGEDVVSGTRTTKPIAALRDEMPRIHAQLLRICRRLERHCRDVQDVEFTIERGRLWILQTRDAKRTAQAAVRIAVDLAAARVITRAEAVQRVSPEHVDQFLHPRLAPADRQAAVARGDRIATGLNVSPGAAVGVAAFDADTAVRWAETGAQPVIMVRPETRPEDVHGMLAAAGILTARGGRTSHAALVARQFGKPAVVGVTALEVDEAGRCFRVGGRVVREGDWVSLDGTTGEVFAGQLGTVRPELEDPHLVRLLGWADSIRRLGVWANADYPRDARRARQHGAEGIGLCRTEHMFFEPERLPLVQQVILAPSAEERAGLLARLLPLQRDDFEGLFQAMDGLPVTIRLLDPPLHEFLPSHDELLRDVTRLETQEALAPGAGSPAQAESLAEKRRLLAAVASLREANPMLGLRGVRLGILRPDLVRMQVRAIFEAACRADRAGVRVRPKIMIPLTSHPNELRIERGILEEEARAVMAAEGRRIAYQFGTMIETPRAALTAGEIARHAEFFSFGTNDLTQMTYALSRDDAETGFLRVYLEQGILPESPFASIDEPGVGRLMALAVTEGRQAHPGLEVGVCGEHGGDPRSIAFCHRIGLDYVSCSPYRVPVARLAAAHAALGEVTDHR
jgi:pyruvate,orthophosphate dikinase